MQGLDVMGRRAGCARCENSFGDASLGGQGCASAQRLDGIQKTYVFQGTSCTSRLGSGIGKLPPRSICLVSHVRRHMEAPQVVLNVSTCGCEEWDVAV